MELRLFLALLAAILFSAVAANAQNTETAQIKQVAVPSNIRREIVRRILVFKFKPAKRPKVINLAKSGVEPSALPKISNIEFRLLSDEEIEDGAKEIYFFTEPGFENKTYSIGFAYGDPQCSYVGDNWNFRITNDRLRLWQAGGIGGGCGGGGGIVKAPGALNTYPNELAGYQFFDRGKLKGLKLTVSTKADVVKNFGSDCDGGCDYDEKWEIYVNYFGSITKETTIDDKRIRYVPRAGLVGKISSISFIPKRPLSFTQIVFPRQFSRLDSFAVGHNYSVEARMTAAVGTSYKTYIDRYGLKYLIFEEITYTVGKAEKDERRKGELIRINYSVPDKTEETMFVEEK